MLLEREQSLKQLTDLCTQSAKHCGNVALVYGEAGIGKTTLLEALKDRAPAKQQFLWGRCDALFTPRPLGPLLDMATHFPPSIQQQLFDRVESTQLFTSILQYLSELKQGVVLVFEDIHWADNATLDFLSFIVRRISLLPILIILSYRDDEVHYEHPLTSIFGLLPSRQTHRFNLTPLSREAIIELGATSKISADEILNVTGGNPFFVTELLEYNANPVGEIPISIKDAINSRMMRLFETERTLLETISVIPGRLSLNLLTNLFGDTAETLAMACVGRKLLVQEKDHSFRFKHELSRLAILSRLPTSQQKDIHQRVLQALLANSSAQDLQCSLDQLVHHAAGADNGKCVLEFAPQAAEKASIVGAHKEAAAHLATALRFVDQASSELAAALYENWAFEASLALRIDDQVLDALRVAITLRRSLGQLEKVGKNLRHLSRLHWMRGEGDTSIRYVEEAIQVLESISPSAELAMAYSVRSQSYLVNDKMEDAIIWGEKALALAEQYRSEEVEIHALNNVGTARIYRNDMSGQALLEKSLRLSLESGRHMDAGRAYANLTEFYVDFRQFELAEKSLADAIAFTTKHDMMAKCSYLQGNLALLRLEQGRLHDAYAISSGVMQVKQQDLLALLPALIVYARTKLRLGQEDALDVLNRVLEDAEQTGEIQFIMPIRLSIVEYAWLEDRQELAKQNFQACLKFDFQLMHQWWLGELFIWAKRIGAELPDHFRSNVPLPYQLELDGNYEQAGQAWQELGLPYEAVLCLLQIPDDTLFAQCIPTIQEAVKDLDAHRALHKLQRECERRGLTDELNTKRRGPYRSAKNHPIGLTKREQEILQLLAKGASNKEISSTLVRSRRTVENHVSTILTKLNAKNRLEAMLRVHNEPWLLPSEAESCSVD